VGAERSPRCSGKTNHGIFERVKAKGIVCWLAGGVGSHVNRLAPDDCGRQPAQTAERGREVGGQRGQAMIMVCGPAVRTVAEDLGGWRPKAD
jgi:hypothetical protein